MATKDDLVSLAKYLSIVHHTVGRIRLRVSPSIFSEVKKFDENDLKDLPLKIKGIKDIKLNKLIGSLTISYDADVFKPQIWDELLAGNISDEILENLSKMIKE